MFILWLLIVSVVLVTHIYIIIVVTFIISFYSLSSFSVLNPFFFVCKFQNFLLLVTYFVGNFHGSFSVTVSLSCAIIPLSPLFNRFVVFISFNSQICYSLQCFFFISNFHDYPLPYISIFLFPMFQHNCFFFFFYPRLFGSISLPSVLALYFLCLAFITKTFLLSYLQTF